MEETIKDILRALESHESLDARELDAILRRHSKQAHDGRRTIAKKHLLPFYLETKSGDPEKFASWNVNDELDARFLRTMKMKPRRTASGVATITVITKPWPCSGDCIYCPNDVRMPKSYLHDEPACQRAERNFFDPYLQVSSRLAALQRMGHVTDKVELIILGGSWCDYPRTYRLWFIRELFRALNADAVARTSECARRSALYASFGITNDAAELECRCSSVQGSVNDGLTCYNAAVVKLYHEDAGWQAASGFQQAVMADVKTEHAANETSGHRSVGLVIETRPDAIAPAALRELRQLGCTKVQIGVQSLRDDILAFNGRASSGDDVARALDLCRLFGFKTHVHMMLNLLGATPQSDASDYRMLVEDHRYLPDEVKLYPCALVAGTGLERLYQRGSWHPYSEDELVEVLCEDMRATPAFTRVSRMIRDISAKDILVGNKKTNLRQLVEERLSEKPADVVEIRFREIGSAEVDLDTLALSVVPYETRATHERFLQWTTPDGKIAGFLRLSLPKPDALARLDDETPVGAKQAMIREVHIYGFAAKLGKTRESSQHHGLGKQLVRKACEIAREAGFDELNVISAIGTRAYYRNLGFADNGLYQTKKL